MALRQLHLQRIHIPHTLQDQEQEQERQCLRLDFRAPANRKPPTQPALILIRMGRAVHSTEIRKVCPQSTPLEIRKVHLPRIRIRTRTAATMEMVRLCRHWTDWFLRTTLRRPPHGNRTMAT
jgi:hypothetical protein